MIKKMLAMLVAISCAVGAWADTHISGTDFSGLTAGDPFVLGLDDSGESTGTTFWYNGDDSDFEGTIVTDGLANYLDFESNITNPLYRTINDSYGLAPSSFQATPIGTGLFIDTHVQFTPYLVNENHPEPTKVTNDDKLIVWVRETEVDGDANITNLIITAGYIAGNGNVSASNYVATLSSAEVSALCTNQCRLTIKSYQNITAYSGVTVMGFVVYINETVVEYIGDAFADGSVFLPLVPGPAQYYSQGGGHNKLLPCLMDYGTDPSTIDSYSKLTAVGYAGMGKIGDVIFDNYNTTYPAFAGDDLAFQVVLGDGVTSFDYLGDTYTTDASFTVDATTASVTISNVLYDTTAGYTHKTGTWHNNVAVDNQVGAGGDYGTFYFANGTILTLVGFQANYIVNGTEYDNLTDALEAALAGGYTLVLNNDVQITEGDGCLYLGSGDTLVLDLKGHTIKGTGDEYTPTIINNGGTLTIVDTSSNQDGKVLHNDNSNLCLGSYSGSTTTLNAGIYEEVDDIDGDLTTITINGGTYLDVVYGPSSFYLSSCIATGKQIVDWIQDGDNNYYAVIGEPSGDTWDITFSTNNVIVTEWNLTVNDGDPIGNHIPNFTGGSWDAPAPTAETVVTSDTNFNYTIAVQLSYFPQIPIEEQWADRDGTPAKPFAIRNAADFAGLKSDIAEGYNADKYFEVVVDNITLTDWTGIGSSSKPFSGTLIGGGKTVNITFSSAKDNGLFAYVSNATLSNLTVNASSGTIGSATGGAAFVGKAAGVTTFVALKATGSLGTSVTPTTHNTAGICERIDTGDSSWIINFNSCTNEMTIYANYTKVGGILAFRDGKSAEVNFNNCVNSANISNAYATAGQYGTGGIMGWTGGTDLGTGITRINGCVNTGTITAADGSAGNFIGYENYSATASGTNIGLASLKPASNWPIDGLNWASVSGDLATFVTPVTTVDGIVTYKVMQSAGASLGFTLADADASLTILTNFYAYTGTVVLDPTLTAQGYELVTTADANGVTFTAGSSDPWAPSAETDEAAAAKAAELFPGTEVAENVDTLAEYEALVTYIKSVTSQSEVPTDLTADQKTWMWKSYILGANPLFDEEPAVQITSLTAGATAGLWDFTVKVTEGDDTDAYNVAADKVGALVKISSSLTPGTWVAPTAGNISAVKLLGGNLIQVEVNFGNGTSGFMKVSE